MIKFKSITLTNFMSYGAIPTIIRLDQPGTTLLLGEDLDNTNSGSGSNGCGKSSILNSIVYALYDKPLSEDIKSKDDLVNFVNKKGMEVAIEFEKNNTHYLIIRCRKMKAGAAGNYTTVYKNGKDITVDSSFNTNDQIEKILEIPYDLFVRIVAFSAEQTSFLKLPTRSVHAANQTDIIEELFDLKTLSSKAEALKVEIKITESSLKTYLEKNDVLKGEHERHKKQLDSAQRRVISWEQSNSQEIGDIKVQIQKLENINVQEQRVVYDQVVSLITIVGDYARQKIEAKRQVDHLQKSINEFQHELMHLQKGECPRCHQTFIENPEKLTNIDRNIFNDKQKLIEQQKLLAGYEISWLEHNTQLKEARKKLQVQNLDELLEIKNKVQQLQNKLNDLINAVNPFIEALDELENIKLEEINMAKVNELKKLLDHQTFLLKLLTKKDSFVRKALLNKNIPFLNARLQKYLIDLDLPHHVEFTHEMTASISKFGHPISFGNLSHGQKARVNLALSFAFRDVLQSMHDTVNICMLDEVLDEGLDAVGVHAAAKMLKKKAREDKIGLYIISHKDEIDNAFDRKMIVQMSGGFSSIKYEDG